MRRETGNPISSATIVSCYKAFWDVCVSYLTRILLAHARCYSLAPCLGQWFISGPLVEIFMHCAEKKVYHVDSHFNNILINPKTGEIKLIDFNQVAIAEDIHMKARKFADNIFGSIPPEAHKHVKPSKLMVWILGQHLYTLLTNKWPSADLDASPPKKFPSRTSKGLRELITKCMALEIDRRPTFQEVLGDFWLRDTPEIPKDLTSIKSDANSGLPEGSSFCPDYDPSSRNAKPLEEVFDL
ncbi:unnamed protein product [Enterobius vermicularis]|uniref:non-specific serine/threonine protein kinase n=1 Tax=Enterobius vermicularis TaxID=51028 RepID=A0A0N4V000_ENTVE|nr:unnamed protein product [Enterobius vermicularis]